MKLSLSINGAGGKCEYALPNMVDAKKEEETKKENWHVQRSCDSVDFITNVCCAGIFQWSFGDGNTSILKNPLHVYSQNGTYYISLIVDQDTMRDTVKVGLEPMKILGDTAVCDAISSHIYQMDRDGEYYSYQWSSDYGILVTSNDGAEVSASWPQTGHLFGIVTDDKTGCSWTDTVNVHLVPLIQDNTITGSENSPYSSTIIGSNPTGGTGNYFYLWHESLDSINWTLVPNAFEKDLDPNGRIDSFKYFRRVAYIAQCFSYSNIMKLERCFSNNKIWYENSACLVGQSFEIEGGRPSSNWVPIPSLNWQYGDGTNWYNVQNNFTDTTWDSTLLYSPMHIRRRLFNPGCSSLPEYSNTLIQKARISVRTQPKNRAVCKGFQLSTFVPLTLGVENEEELNISYSWTGSFNYSVLHSSNDSLALSLEGGEQPTILFAQD